MILTQSVLQSLAGAPEAKLKVPTYDRSKLKRGVLHIGVGNCTLT